MARDEDDIWGEEWIKGGGRHGNGEESGIKDRNSGKKDASTPFRRVENISKYIVLVKKEEVGEGDVFVGFDLENELKVLGNLVDKEGVEIHKKEERLGSVSKLLKAGVIVEELGVLVDRRSDGNIYDRENSLRDVDKESIVKLLDKIKNKEKDNYVISVLGAKVAERCFEKEVAEESANILVERIDLEEIKNSLPTSLSSNIETTDDSLKRGEVTVTHVLALDIIQRVIYSDEEIRLPIVEDGKVIGWEKKKIENLNILENDTEGHVFNALARHFWKDMVVHGIYDKDGKLRLNSDSDGEVCRYLMNKAGVPIKADENAYKDFNELRPGAVHMDMGQKNGYCVYLEEVNGKTVVTLIIDHHAPDSKSDISASGWVYMGLAKLGLLENPERFAGLVDFLNKTDNGQPIKEVDEIVNDFNDKHSTKLTKREYLLQELQNTVWGLKRFIKAPKLIEFFEKGRNPLEKLSKRDLSGKDGLGVIFEQGADYKKEGKKRIKVKDGIIIDKQKEFQSHLENSLNELQKIEKAGFIFESEKYGRIVVDIGGKMMGLGNELSSACGYDGYISWKPEEQSFMLTTRLPLDVDFPQGIKVREHMWIKKPEMGGDLKIEFAEILRILNGGKDASWTNGLMNEQVEIKINEVKEIVWEDDVWKDLKLAVGYSPERDEAQKRLKSKYGIVFDSAANETTEVQQRLLSAIDTAVTGKPNELFTDVEMAKNELRKYFGGTEINLNKLAEGNRVDVEMKEDKERDDDKEKYLEYLGEEFLEDLRKAYPEMQGNKPKGLEWSEVDEAAKKLKNKGFGEFITKKDNRDRRDFRSGRRFRERLNNYLAGKPVDEEKAFFDQVKVMKIEVVNLEEARKRGLKKDNGQLKRDGKKEDGGAGGKGNGKIDRDNFDFNGKTLEQLLDMAPDSTDPKFYIAARVILGEADSRFPSVEEAKKYFFDQIEGKKEFELTVGVRNLLKDWVDIRDGSARPGLPSGADNLARLVDIGFDPTQAVLDNVRQALYSISFTDGDVEGSKKYLSSLFAGGAAGGGEPEESGESKDKMKENGEMNDEEKWNKVSDLLANLETVSGDERIALYLEIEQCGVRIRGTVSDLIEAGAGEEEVKKSFRHMANMVKVWKMGEAKAKREYPKMVEKYASMARLLRLKWYN